MVNSVVFSPQEQELLLTASDDATIKLGAHALCASSKLPRPAPRPPSSWFASQKHLRCRPPSRPGPSQAGAPRPHRQSSSPQEAEEGGQEAAGSAAWPPLRRYTHTLPPTAARVQRRAARGLPRLAQKAGTRQSPAPSPTPFPWAWALGPSAPRVPWQPLWGLALFMAQRLAQDRAPPLGAAQHQGCKAVRPS